MCFVKLSTAFFITCDSKNSDVGFGHFTTCEPKFIDTTNDKFIESVITWPLNKGLVEFTQFYVEHSNTVYFPGNLHQKFPNLEVVILWNSRVKYVESFDLRGLMNLKFLRLNDNEIEILQSDLFLHNLQLMEIHLQNNKLKFIGAKLLFPLTRLKLANFTSNVCIDEIADTPSAFESIRKSIEEQCGAPEFLVKKNLELIKKLVDFNYTNADLSASNAKLGSQIKMGNESLATCEIENEDLNDKKFKVEMRLRKESSALKKLQREITSTRDSNDELIIENVKLNNELKRLNKKISEGEEGATVWAVGNVSSCGDGSTDLHRLKFENSKLLKDNKNLKSFKEEVEKEWRSVSLKCEFTSWDGGYTCQTISLNIRSDDTEITKVIGKHEGHKSNYDVKSLLISSEDVRVTFLPVNIGSVFPKLKTFAVQDSKVIFVKRGNFDNLISLEGLMLDHNQIEAIPAGTFDDLESLIKLDLSCNRITKLDKESFFNLKKLKFLSVSDNQIEKLSASIFRFNPQLEVISFEQNQIKFIGSSMMKGLRNVKFANFIGNFCIDGKFTEASLMGIDGIIMSQCTPPTDIYCKFESTSDVYACTVNELHVENENTMIQEVNGNHLRGKSNDDVTQLLIDSQTVLNLPIGFGKFFKSLKKISVRNSKLTSIDDGSFEMMQQVSQVIFTENDIATVPEEAFQKLKSLEIIELSNNKIVKVDIKAFNNLTNLKVLKLDGNKLTTLHSNLFVHNSNLEELHVRNNKLNSIGAHLLNNLRKLQIVDFTDNSCITQNFPEIALQALKLKILEQCK